MKFIGLPQIKGSKKWQMLCRDFQVVFLRIKSLIVFYILKKTEYYPYKKTKVIKKIIEGPRSLLLNQRSLYSVALIIDKHNSPRKIRIKTPSIRLFHGETPDFQFVFYRVTSFNVIFVFFMQAEEFSWKKTTMINKKTRWRSIQSAIEWTKKMRNKFKNWQTQLIQKLCSQIVFHSSFP